MLPRARDPRDVTAVREQGAREPWFDGPIGADHREKAKTETDFTSSHTAQECLGVGRCTTVAREYPPRGPRSN
jgi:hypothetical protein